MWNQARWGRLLEIQYSGGETVQELPEMYGRDFPDTADAAAN